MTGWALFLDYLIVIALSALFLPHYLAGALRIDSLTHNPWDVVVGITVILTVAGVRLVRRPSLYRIGIFLASLDLVTQLLLVILGFALVFSTDALTDGTHLGTSPTWHDLAFALPLAMLAYTGLETVANLAEEARRPGVDLPRALFGAIGTAVTLYVAVALVAVAAFPGPETALGREWLRAPLVGLAIRIGSELPSGFADILRFFVGASGVLVLLAAVTTSMSGFSRLAYSLGEHGQLPHAFGRLHRRTLVSPQSILAAALLSSAIVLATAFVRRDVSFLASLFSFGVLLAFTATQLAVVKLRVDEPDLPRPYRVPLNINVGRAEVPVPAVVGAVLTFAVWIISMVTHAGARYAGPAWLVVGLVVYVTVRRAHGEGLTERVVAPDEQRLTPLAPFRRILVPIKLGIIGEEMLATAIKLAAEHEATVEALHVIRVPLEMPLDAELIEHDERAEAALAEAKLLGSEWGVNVVGTTVRHRSIGEAIVDQARKTSADVIVLGSAPRWRRQSRFFSPTVDWVLRKAPCEVLIVAFPQEVMDEELAG
jgi:APA family basic amino acid/polyamine antiporter